uniref:Peptidase M14 domain-containing protein n=1 Tax=Oreochromis aureus TaxID=47969 RepID=A0AAZ1X048_OREAU
MSTPLIWFVFMNLSILLKPGHCTETGDQVLSITPQTQEQVDILRNVSTHYETVLWQPVSNEYISTQVQAHLYVPANSSVTVKAILQKHGITHKVLLANPNELTKMQMKNDSTDPRSSSTFYERYHTLEEIYDWINRTAQDNPRTVKVILIGSSYEKRPLYVLKSLSFYQQNSEITRILDSMDVYVLPVMNPDGYKYTWTTIKRRWWRKNRSISKSGFCVGVDLNRNFDVDWGIKGSSQNPCEEINCGPFPESEPETQAVANFLRRHKDTVQLYITIHSYSQMLIFPYSYTFDQAENHNDLLEMVQEAAQRIKRYYRNTYTYGPGAAILYPCSGGSDDWAYKLGIKYSFTFELQDRGEYGFLLPPSHISGACNEALLAVKTVAVKVLEKTQAPANDHTI